MDHHDITRDRVEEKETSTPLSREDALSEVLSKVPSRSLVIGIASDVLFTPEQQEVLVNALPAADLIMIPSPEGHDGFLLEFEVLGPLIENHLRERNPGLYEGDPLVVDGSVVEIVKNSVFGEVESGW